MNNTTVTLNDNLHYLDDIIRYYKHQNVYKVKIFSDFDGYEEYKHTLSIVYPSCKIEDVQFNSGILKRTCYIDILQSKITTIKDSDNNTYFICIDIKANISFGSTENVSGVQFLCGSYSIEEMYNHYRKYDRLEYILLSSGRYVQYECCCNKDFYYRDLNIKENAIVNLKIDEFDRAFTDTLPKYGCHVNKKDTTFKYLIGKQCIKTIIDEYGDKHDVLVAYIIFDKEIKENTKGE